MLDTANTSKILADEYKSFSTANPDNPDRPFLDFLQKTLDDHFQMADTSSGNFVITPPAGSLYFNKVSGNDMAYEIGRGCAEYWGKAIELGAPEVCLEVVSVSNDADKIEDLIGNDLLNVYEQSEPHFFNFVDVIYKHVKSIKWTIVEADEPNSCSATISGSVS